MCHRSKVENLYSNKLKNREFSAKTKTDSSTCLGITPPQSQRPVKRSFLLLEVLTSSFIAGIVIAACVTLLMLFITRKGKEETDLFSSQKRWQSASYLRWVIMNIKQKKEPLFVVEDGPGGSQRIIFHMNHGIDPSPNDSSDMLAMLYLDREKGLMLVHKPLKQRKEMGLEEEKAYSIWPNAQEVKWKFFTKNELVQEGSQQKAEWKETWPKDEKKLPLAIKASIVEKSERKETVQVEVTGIVLSQLKDATIHVR
jgi:hypothetical protein